MKGLNLMEIARVQKELGTSCELSLSPFLNDPLAFLDEKDLDKKVDQLRAELARVMEEKPVLKDHIGIALAKINENQKIIKRAQKRLEQLVKITEENFSGWEITGRSSLYQPTGFNMLQTLWVEAFKEKDGVELSFEAHVGLDKSCELALIKAVTKQKNESVRQKMKKFNGDEWEYMHRPEPFGHVYTLKRRNHGERVDKVIEDAGSLMAKL